MKYIYITISAFILVGLVLLSCTKRQDVTNESYLHVNNNKYIVFVYPEQKEFMLIMDTLSKDKQTLCGVGGDDSMDVSSIYNQQTNDYAYMSSILRRFPISSRGYKWLAISNDTILNIKSWRNVISMKDFKQQIGLVLIDSVGSRFLPEDVSKCKTLDVRDTLRRYFSISLTDTLRKYLPKLPEDEL